MIASLPPGMADAINLVLGLGLSYEEAAAVCNCAPGTMKSRVSRARAILVERLNGPPPGQDEASAGPRPRYRAA
jgi:RNA polymerase sigma-70 factor (ECF subfamily)